MKKAKRYLADKSTDRGIYTENDVFHAIELAYLEGVEDAMITPSKIIDDIIDDIKRVHEAPK